MNDYKISFKDISWESPVHGVQHKNSRQNKVRLRLVEFSKDFIETDWCTKGHAGYVLEGKGELDINGRKIIFTAGDGIYIPSGTDHKHKLCVLTNIFKVILFEEI